MNSNLQPPPLALPLPASRRRRSPRSIKADAERQLPSTASLNLIPPPRLSSPFSPILRADPPSHRRASHPSTCPPTPPPPLSRSLPAQRTRTRAPAPCQPCTLASSALTCDERPELPPLGRSHLCRLALASSDCPGRSLTAPAGAAASAVRPIIDEYSDDNNKMIIQRMRCHRCHQ